MSPWMKIMLAEARRYRDHWTRYTGGPVHFGGITRQLDPRDFHPIYVLRLYMPLGVFEKTIWEEE